MKLSLNKEFPLRFATASVEETMHLGEAFAKTLPCPALVLFYGNLGAGKTSFIKGMAKALGLKPTEVTSPTFTLLHSYEKESLKLFHFDLYRLKNAKEFVQEGFHEFFETGICCIEWPQRLEGIKLPSSFFKVSLQHQGEDKRLIEIMQEPIS